MSEKENPAPGAAPREWFRDAFGEFYPLVYAHRDDAEAERAITMAAPHLARGPVLDLACGTGRHLRALDRRGIVAFGLDLSAALLRRAAADSARARLVRGDMRALPFRAAAFGAVVSLFSSFGYFPDADDDVGVLREIRRVLRDNGRLVLDLANPYDARHRDSAETERRVEGYTVREWRRRLESGRRIEKRVAIHDAGGDVVREYVESLRLYEPSEIATHAALQGLGLVSWIGGYDGTAWRPDSPRLIGVFEAAGAPRAPGGEPKEESR